jgi:cysteine desulfurase
MKTINLDNAAASPLEPDVLEAMLPFFTEHYGNPSSGHELGNAPRKEMEEARASVARLINAEPREIIFTASATEANNLAIKGLLAANRGKGNQIISSVVEHFSVLNQLKTLEKDGFKVTLLPVDKYGLLIPISWQSQ